MTTTSAPAKLENAARAWIVATQKCNQLENELRDLERRQNALRIEISTASLALGKHVGRNITRRALICNDAHVLWIEYTGEDTKPIVTLLDAAAIKVV